MVAIQITTSYHGYCYRLMDETFNTEAGRLRQQITELQNSPWPQVFERRGGGGGGCLLQ